MWPEERPLLMCLGQARGGRVVVDQQLLEAALPLPMRVLFTEASELMFGEPLHRTTALPRISCNFNSFLACAGGEIAKATRAAEACLRQRSDEQIAGPIFDLESDSTPCIMVACNRGFISNSLRSVGLCMEAHFWMV